MTKHHAKNKVDELRDALKKQREAGERPAASPPASPKEGGAPEVAGERAQGAGADLADEIRAAEEEAKNHYDKLLRVMAEFENFKRRMGKEQEEQLKYANEKLLAELLPSLDDLDRVLDHVAPDASEDARKIAEGVELVRKTLTAALGRYGLKEVPALGEAFDPTRHEAIAAVESEAHEPGSVMGLHRKGYWLGERLLRPAMVTVAKARD